MQWAKMVPELTVSDFHASLDFYVKVLGFQLAYSRHDSFAYLERHGVQLMLEQAPPTWPVAELVPPYGRGINLQIEWPDVTDLRDHLVACHYPLYRDIEETWRDVGVAGALYGSREFLVQDPDGYLLRFAQPLGERSINRI